jgi:lipopolysaccharide/colanic/teichoic acid biosynthesis glycosyltransferase
MLNTALHKYRSSISTYDQTAERWTYKYLKRVLDFLLSLLLLVVLSPFLIVIAAIVKLTSPGPAFYPWHIVGQKGVRFTSYKFRTMIKDAEALEKPLRARGCNEMRGAYFKIRHDPRVTPVGAFLRKFSLDELPSLFSVLVGKMSLVGPRPVRESEFHQLSDWHKLRLSVKPGVTGIWQCSGKNKINDFNHIVALDLEYIAHWSLLLDIRIILKTIPTVLLGRNY